MKKQPLQAENVHAAEIETKKKSAAQLETRQKPGPTEPATTSGRRKNISANKETIKGQWTIWNMNEKL